MTIRRSALLTALFLSGCFGLGGFTDDEGADVAFANQPRDTSSMARWSGSTVALDASELEADLHGRYRVAPDRALVRVDVVAGARQRATAATRIREVSAELAATLSAVDHCVATVADYHVPQVRDDLWIGRATLRLDVQLAGLEDVDERFARVERCMESFRTLGGSLSDVELTVSEPLVTIDAPESHRSELIERELRGLREVAEVDGPAAFEPSGMRCVSRGAVQITQRSLAGIALRVDLECSPRTPAPVFQTTAMVVPPADTEAL